MSRLSRRGHIPARGCPKRAGEERGAELALGLLASLSLVTLGLIFIFLLREALPFFDRYAIGAFLTGREWQPVSTNPRFGLVPLATGSLLVTVGAAVIAVPVGVGVALFLSEVAPRRLREMLKPGLELLAAIPSVVYGFFGLVVLSRWLQAAFGLNSGLNALNGSILLAVMSLPTIVTLSEDALRAVPDTYRAASLAMGASRLETMLHVTLPAARSGIVAAVMLGLGRVIGETMAVLMVTGNAAQVSFSLLDSVRTMTATIAAEMAECAWGSTHYHALFAVGAVLFAVTFLVNAAADVLLRKGVR
ncbi:MAG: phosphate ABC transporter permease subunit PstC [Firmicutes bacterium]|nr:phosphate ABC transporter permease subunit PstC [Bacillota bacterium]